MFNISVIIPTFNRSKLLERCVQSVIDQTYPVREVVIVDDGSTDETEVVVSTLIKRHSDSETAVRYVKQKQQGPAAARNTGIAATTGEWIAFLDSDDLWLPEKLELQTRALEKCADACSACVTDASYMNNPALKLTAFEQAGMHFTDSTGVLPNLAKRIAYGFHGVYLPTLLVRREIIRDWGGFDPKLNRIAEDSDFLFQLACRTNVAYVSKALVRVDRTPDRTVGALEYSRNEGRMWEIYRYLYEKWLGEAQQLPLDVRERIVWRLQEVHYGRSSWYLLNGERKKALEALSLGMRYRLSPEIFGKWLMIRLAPGLAKRLVIKKRARTPAKPLL